MKPCGITCPFRSCPECIWQGGTQPQRDPDDDTEGGDT